MNILKKIFLFICAFTVLLFNSLSGQILYSGSKVVDNVKRSCVSIETIKKTDDIRIVEPIKLGSGVLVLKKGEHYYVTNHHVINSLKDKDILLVGLNLKSGKVYGEAKITAYDQVKDIAILRLSGGYFSKTNTSLDSQYIDQIAVGISIFGDSASFREGTGIITIGFPLGLGTEITGNQPIIRSGIIAQMQRSDGTFLVDGIASHGNSGSPIFNLETGRFIGIVKGFPNDFITAFDENGQLVAKFPYNSGLSICISSAEIWKLVP